MGDNCSVTVQKKTEMQLLDLPYIKGNSKVMMLNGVYGISKVVKTNWNIRSENQC